MPHSVLMPAVLDPEGSTSKYNYIISIDQYGQQQKYRSITLVSGNMRYIHIFMGFLRRCQTTDEKLIKKANLHKTEAYKQRF